MKRKGIFEQIGFSPNEAAELEIRSDLLSKIVEQAKHFSQPQLQQMLNESQPRIRDLMRGQASKFSLETLIGYAEALHLKNS
jgi:predicted XRE-type DNA-binding protein